MSLTDLLAALRRFWLLALLVFFGVLVLGGAAAYLPKPKYQATATLIVQPKDINFATINAINFLLPSVVEEVKTGEFQQRVLARVGPAVAAAHPTLSAAFEAGTAIVRISAESTVPDAAASAANAAARQVVAKPVNPSVRMTLLAPASVPTSPVSPRKVPILAGSFVLGLIFAVFSVIAAGAVRRRVQTSEEIQERFGIEVLAEVPARRKLPTNTLTVFEDDRYADIAEAFQRLRTNVEFAADGDLVIAVTSSAPGEGKSTIAASLAWGLATVGHEVVAIDADLRRPTLHRYFGGHLDRGLANMNDDGLTAVGLLQQTGCASLSLLSAGRSDRHASQVIHNVLPGVLAELDGRAIVIDTPPLLGVSEAAMVANLTGNALLVIDARRRNPAELVSVLRELQRGDTRVLGAAVNRARLAHRSYTQAYIKANDES